MVTSKKWDKSKEGIYTLVGNEGPLAQLLPLKNKDDFNVVIGHETFKINSSGLLGQKLEIRESRGDRVLTLEPKKWYSNVFVIRYNDRTYQLMVRNNPLCEFVIVSEKEELLAYALDVLKETNTVVIRMTEKDTEQPILFHVLLWHFFAPVAQENSGDSFWWIYGI